MKPSSFDYVKPESLSEALGVLAANKGQASVLAGGQSLMPTLNMRLSSPRILVDINGLEELKGISVDSNIIRIGALVRHHEVENSPDIQKHASLISKAMPYVAHPAIRNQGTFGGSIALADPAAELPACICVLEGEVEISGKDGLRKIPAENFFKDLYETDLGEDEIVTAIEIPIASQGYVSAFSELARRHGDYAMTGVGIHAKLEGDKISQVRIGFFAVAGVPMMASNAADALNNKVVNADTISAAKAALETDLTPVSDLHCSAKMKMLYAKELMSRSLMQLMK